MHNAQGHCLSCGKDISFKRSDAKYCSDRCRMRFQRQQKKIELLKELVTICSQIPHHTAKNNDGELMLKLNEAIKSNLEMVAISELLELSIAKIEHLITKKRKKLNAFNVVNSLRRLLNSK